MEAQIHPITPPILHKPTRSILARLPDNILLRIMSHGDDIDILCLRRTCRTMLRLTAGPEFSRLYSRVGQRFSSGYPQEQVPEAAKDQLHSLLRRDMYCELCRTVESEMERRLREESLYCSGCRLSHLVGLFSFRQRRSESDRTRICIGREGYLRACQHLTVSWAQIERWLKTWPRYALSFQCDDASHGQSWPLAGHPNTSLHRHVTVEIGKIISDYGNQSRLSRVPGNYVLRISWDTHLNLPALGQEEGIEVSDIIVKVEWIRQNGGSYIFRDRGDKFPQEMRFFDPNICSCLRLPSPPPGRSWNWNNRENTESALCSFHNRKDPRRPPLVYLNSGKIKANLEFFEHCGCIMNEPWEDVVIKKCSSLASCVHFNYTKNVPMGPSRYYHCKGVTDPETGKCMNDTQPWWASWYMSVDPESISLRDDEDSKGIYWCDTKTCLNYYANHRHNPKRRALDPTHEPGVLNGCSGAREKTRKKTESKGLLTRLRSVFRRR